MHLPRLVSVLAISTVAAACGSSVVIEGGGGGSAAASGGGSGSGGAPAVTSTAGTGAGGSMSAGVGGVGGCDKPPDTDPSGGGCPTEPCPPDFPIDCVSYREGEVFSWSNCNVQLTCEQWRDNIALNTMNNPHWGHVWALCSGVLVYDSNCP